MTNYEHSNRSTSSGLSFISVLQLIFIVLKLCNVIDWSWWQVMLPIIIEVGIAVIIAIFFFGVLGIRKITDTIKG